MILINITVWFVRQCYIMEKEHALLFVFRADVAGQLKPGKDNCGQLVRACGTMG